MSSQPYKYVAVTKEYKIWLRSHSVLPDGKQMGGHLSTAVNTLQTASMKIPIQADTAIIWQKNSANSS